MTSVNHGLMYKSFLGSRSTPDLTGMRGSSGHGLLDVGEVLFAISYTLCYFPQTKTSSYHVQRTDDTMQA